MSGRVSGRCAGQVEVTRPAWRAPRRRGKGGQNRWGSPGQPMPTEKICIAVVPWTTPLLTAGTVTDCTVLPACSGTDAE